MLEMGMVTVGACLPKQKGVRIKMIQKTKLLFSSNMIFVFLRVRSQTSYK